MRGNSLLARNFWNQLEIVSGWAETVQQLGLKANQIYLDATNEIVETKASIAFLSQSLIVLDRYICLLRMIELTRVH